MVSGLAFQRVLLAVQWLSRLDTLGLAYCVQSAVVLLLCTSIVEFQACHDLCWVLRCGCWHAELLDGESSATDLSVEILDHPSRLLHRCVLI